MSSRLSALDASFLSVETPTAHMHVGFVATFSPSGQATLPSYQRLREHIECRLEQAPRFRQKLAPVPLGMNAPEWVDDDAFSIDRHVYWASGPLGSLADEVMSMPLRRDRPLWEMWVCEEPQLKRLTVVGKAHHCMVDGLAAVQLAAALLDASPEVAPRPQEGWQAVRRPGSERLLLRAIRDRLSEQLVLLRWPLRAARAPTRACAEATAGALRLARALGHTISAAPSSMLNRPLSPLRRLACTQRPLADLQTVKRTYGTTVNDVMLAAVAGGIRDYLIERGERPPVLKAMVPVSMRGQAESFGNRLSFLFPPLPCDEPRPISRLYKVHAAMGKRKRGGEPEGAELALKAAAHTPGYVQQAIARMLASPRMFNLVVSNIPGPPVPLYLLGCPLEALFPVVPLADCHIVSVGMMTVAGNACFGVYADRERMPDVQALAAAIDSSITELLEQARQATPPKSGRRRRADTAASNGRPAPVKSR